MNQHSSISKADPSRDQFRWIQSGPLMQLDHQLLQRAIAGLGAGILVKTRQMLKFISPALENRLARTEHEYAIANGHRTIDSIPKTVFISRPQGDGDQFVVTDQQHREPKD